MLVAAQRGEPSSRPHPSQDGRDVLVPQVALPDASGVLLIVVNADDVSFGALPTVVANDRARGIERLGQVVERLDEVLLRWMTGQVRHAPGLVERHPGDDTGMADVTEQRGGPLPGKTIDATQGEAIGAGHLLPDQETQAIRPVEIPRILDLLVLANAIEPHRLGKLDVAAQSIVIRRRHAAVGPVPLVQDESQLKRAVVQNEPISFDTNRSQRRVAENLVNNLTVRSEEAKRGVDQGR